MDDLKFAFRQLLKNPGLTAVALLHFLVATCCRAAEPDAPPPLGKLYEVGGHKMHLYHGRKGELP